MILLINPKTTKTSQINSDFFREPNLGLLYLAALLDVNYIPVDILDLEQYSGLNELELKDLISEKATEYNVFGITSLSNTFSLAVDIARIIKSCNRNHYVVLGGPHVSFLYQDVLQNDLNGEKLIDFICVGESEISFIKLVKFLSSFNYKFKKFEKINSKLNVIKGIAYYTSNGEIIFTGYSSKAVDIEKIPLPARYLLNQDSFYYNVANVIVNRGCPNQCSFCSRQNLFKKIRIRSIGSILSEIREIVSLQSYNYINFYDNININHKFFRNFCEMFIENNIKIPWGCELRVDTITEDDVILLKEAGCLLVATGIESANRKILNLNFKYQDPEKVRNGIINLKEKSIPIQAYFVLGLPGETQDSFNETLEFIRKLPFDEHDKINYFVATPFPGSRLWDCQENFGIKIIEYDFNKYDCEHIIFTLPNLNQNELAVMLSKSKKIENFFTKKNSSLISK